MDRQEDEMGCKSPDWTQPCSVKNAPNWIQICRLQCFPPFFVCETSWAIPFLSSRSSTRFLPWGGKVQHWNAQEHAHSHQYQKWWQERPSETEKTKASNTTDQELMQCEPLFWSSLEDFYRPASASVCMVVISWTHTHLAKEASNQTQSKQMTASKHEKSRETRSQKKC